MTTNTKIEWADHTFNPWWGCTKISPACDNCYAAALDKRTGGDHWGAGQERRRTKPANWAQPLKWNTQHEAFFAEHGRRQRVFCASMADVFDNAVIPNWRGDLFHLIAETPNLDWLLLTKRIGNARAMIKQGLQELGNGTDVLLDTWPWPNVWLGATICNQEEADRDIPKLLAVSASKRFLSMEPLLGQVEFSNVSKRSDAIQQLGKKAMSGIDWVIAGGESGPNARPMHPSWATSLRDQCKAAEVPFFFKQWGEWSPVTFATASPAFARAKARHLDGVDVFNVGKKTAGRELDGVEWNLTPKT